MSSSERCRLSHLRAGGVALVASLTLVASCSSCGADESSGAVAPDGGGDGGWPSDGGDPTIGTPVCDEPPAGARVFYVDGYLLFGTTDPDGVADLFTGVQLSHNLFFHSSNAAPFRWGLSWEDDYDHDAWLSLPGAPHGQGDVYADPALAQTSTFDPLDKCPAEAASPAVDQGVDLGISVDFFDAPRPAGAGFDLGACELQ